MDTPHVDQQCCQANQIIPYIIIERCIIRELASGVVLISIVSVVVVTWLRMDDELDYLAFDADLL